MYVQNVFELCPSIRKMLFEEMLAFTIRIRQIGQSFALGKRIINER